MDMIANTERSVTFATALAELTGMLAEVIGEDFLVDVELTGETTFSEDLALESIEFVALAEKLQERYERQVDFPAFLAGLEIEEIMALAVGQLVDHITRCLGSPGTLEPRPTPVRSPERAPSRDGG